MMPLARVTHPAFASSLFAVFALAMLASASGCGSDGDGPADAGTAHDAAAGFDAGTVGDAGSPHDAAEPRDAYVAVDAGGGTDAGPSRDAGLTSDAALPSCTAAGGSCVAVVPTACADGVVGTADWYSCGGGIGVMCCLPTNTAPVCRHTGEAEEGWYRPDGTRICAVRCSGHVAMCDAIGTRSEGWYADGTGAGCMGDRLIGWTNCAP